VLNGYDRIIFCGFCFAIHFKVIILLIIISSLVLWTILCCFLYCIYLLMFIFKCRNAMNVCWSASISLAHVKYISFCETYSYHQFLTGSTRGNLGMQSSRMCLACWLARFMQHGAIWNCVVYRIFFNNWAWAF